MSHIQGYLAKDCSNSIADALELPQSCIKPSICSQPIIVGFELIFRRKKQSVIDHA